MAMPDQPSMEQRAIRAVAKQYAAKLTDELQRSSARLSVRGRPVVLEVARLSNAAQSGKPARPARRGASPSSGVRLREDKVAQRVLRDLEQALDPKLQDGRTIILTLGAPIRVANRLVAALSDALVDYLAHGSAELDVSRRMLGNRVRFRVMEPNGRWQPQLIGFVFSGDPRPAMLAGTMVSLYDAVANAPGGRNPAPGKCERWLAVVSENWIADASTYQRALSKLAPRHDYRRIFIVSAGGRVEPIAESSSSRISARR